MIDDNLYTQFDNVFFEKTRLSMMTIMYREGSVSFNRLKKVLGASDGAIYTHLQKLEASKYITQKKELIANKAQTSYTLSKEGKKQFRQYLRFLEDMVNQIPG